MKTRREKPRDLEGTHLMQRMEENLKHLIVVSERKKVCKLNKNMLVLFYISFISATDSITVSFLHSFFDSVAVFLGVTHPLYHQ